MHKPRKIVFNGKFLSAEPTGVHRVAEELVRHCLNRIDADPNLSSKLEPELWVPQSGQARAEALNLPHRIVGPLDGIAWEQLVLPVRANGRTIVSLCNVGPVAAQEAVTMFHDAQVWITPSSYSAGFRAWYRFHQPLAGRRHRRILTVSDFSREQLAHFGLSHADKTGVILNGVDHVLDIAPDAGIVARLGLDDKRYVVGLANLQTHKNIALLLRAFAAPELADLKLVLFGSAGRAAFEAAGNRVPDNVVFAGRVSDGELRALYAHALCLAFPSTTEGFGLPPLEAMTTGCPAIVAPAGALPQACGTAAIYADPANAAAWVSEIRKLADDPYHRDRLSKAGTKHAALFTWSNAASHLIGELLAL